jgi:choline-glycine betaine transporter
MRRQISRISIGQTSKFFAVFYGVIGLVIAVVYLFTTKLAGVADFNIVAALGFPIIYAACIWVFTALGAWVYNQIADRIGGVEFEVVDVGSNPSELLRS